MADLDPSRAKAAAEAWGVRAVSPEEMLADPEVDLVVNLTTPDAHYAAARAALEAGKHAYNEKPLAILREEGKELLSLAHSRGVLVGGAPDTFLGAGLQTCRRLIDEGAIGEPVAAQAFMMCHGHEGWHPSPEFYYQRGGGPLFDMGPYYLTALVSLLGPIAAASGMARVSFPTRTIGSEPKRGQVIQVEVPTHVTGSLRFASGALAGISMSFDVPAHGMPCIQVYGSAGTLDVPDPNGFGGPARLYRSATREWEEVPVYGPYAENSRGVGVVDLALAAREGRPARASGDLAFHVLDAMHALHESAESGHEVALSSSAARPSPMPPGPLAG